MKKYLNNTMLRWSSKSVLITVALLLASECALAGMMQCPQPSDAAQYCKDGGAWGPASLNCGAHVDTLRETDLHQWADTQGKTTQSITTCFYQDSKNPSNEFTISRNQKYIDTPSDIDSTWNRQNVGPNEWSCSCISSTCNFIEG